MNTLIILSAVFAIVGMVYVIYDILTHDKKIKEV